MKKIKLEMEQLNISGSILIPDTPKSYRCLINNKSKYFH